MVIFHCQINFHETLWLEDGFTSVSKMGLTFVKFFEGVISETPIASSHSHQRFPEQRKEPEQFGLFVFFGGGDGGQVCLRACLLVCLFLYSSIYQAQGEENCQIKHETAKGISQAPPQPVPISPEK